jgi:CBS domain containing-hemolysin-like protein
MELSIAGVLWRLAGVLALVFANGFFVAAEFSIVTVRKTRIDQMIAEGHRGARAVRRAVSDPDSYIAATQLGITMASIGLGWIGEPALASMVQPMLTFLPLSMVETTAHSVAIAVAFAVITALHIVLGELAPKTIALERAEKTALIVVKPTELFMKALWPFIRLLNGMGRAVVNLLGMKSSGHALVHSQEELKMLVTASQEAGVLEEQEEQMLHRVFGFADITVSQVMVPRTELAAIDADAPKEKILDLIRTSGYARLPVYRKDLDNIIGILYVTDLVKMLATGNMEIHPASLAREALTVPETLGADDLLAAIRRRGVREAIVIDEYGGTAGFVTFDSLMERIVGDLGATAEGGGRISVQPDGSANIDGLALVPDINEQFGLSIDEDTYTTIGGYVLGRLGRRARVGDTLDVERRKLKVTAIDGLRVAKVWLSTPSRRVSSADSPDQRGKT